MLKNRLISLLLLSLFLFVPQQSSFGHGNHWNGNKYGHCNGHAYWPWWSRGRCYDRRIRISEVQKLDFGTIAPSNIQKGRVRVRPHVNGSSRCSPGITCLQSGNRALFRVERVRPQMLSVSLPQSILLTNQNGDQMKVNKFTSSFSETNHCNIFVPGTETILLGVGATLRVKAQQPRGVYRGTFDVTVEYN